MIEVRLFATFRDGREKTLFLEAQKYSCAADILNHLNIPVEEVSILLINGRHSKPEAKLKDEDVLALFPPVGGG